MEKNTGLKMTLFLCTYASSAEKNAAEILRATALRTGGVDHVVILDDEHTLIKTLREKATDALQFDWQYWKPYVVQYLMHNLADNDVLVYCDATLSFTQSIRPRIDALGNVLLFHVGDCETKDLRQEQFCKPDAFAIMGCTDPVFQQAYQVDSGIQIYKKTAASLAFIQAYVEFCSQSEIMDSHNRHCPKIPRHFVRHCHEQSVLTNLAVKAGISTQPSPIEGYESSVEPFLAIAKPPANMHKTMVVTPTTGTSYLARCIECVQKQTLPGVHHLIIIDGPDHAEKVQAIMEPYRLKMPLHVMVLPFPAGAQGWLGHRIYAGLSFLLDYDYIAFLDEDNTYDPNHLQLLHETVVSGNLDWSFSLRKILDVDGNFVCLDNCESLGNLCHTVMSWNDFLIDTSSFFLSRKVAQEMAPHWMHRARTGGIEADRSVTRFLLEHPTFKGRGVPHHTLNYVAARTGSSVKPEFFLQGNEVFKYDFAARPSLYIFHFNREATDKCLLTMHKTDRSYAVDEWNPTLLRGLCNDYNLVNGFAMINLIPPGSVAYISLCHAHELPPAILQRTDIKKICFTLESPNIRHQAQWDLGFLQKFDHILTYWTPLLEDSSRTTFCPHNTHHLDVENPLDMALLHTPTKPAGKDVAIVLECRQLGGDYTINDIPLKCLDPLRKHYVKHLTDITAFGIGWTKKLNPALKIGHTKHRSLDDRTTVDTIKDYTFVLIVENNNGAGYVSEKLYDAYIAGCIPLYYGNNNSSVDIPKEMYVDLKQYQTSEQLQNYLDSLSLEDVEKMRKAVLDGRVEVLKRVSVQAFAQKFKDFLKIICPHTLRERRHLLG